MCVCVVWWVRGRGGEETRCLCQRGNLRRLAVLCMVWLVCRGMGRIHVGASDRHLALSAVSYRRALLCR